MQENPYCSLAVTHGLKKEKNHLFDITMERCDGAEICELVTLYLLRKLTPLIGTKNAGLYRNDGILSQTSHPPSQKNCH